jgi:hypothetical protein
MAKKEQASAIHALVLRSGSIAGTLHVSAGQVIEADPATIAAHVSDGTLDDSPAAVAHARASGAAVVVYSARPE